jgi:hypothetical protein
LAFWCFVLLRLYVGVWVSGCLLSFTEQFVLQDSGKCIPVLPLFTGVWKLGSNLNIPVTFTLSHIP